MRGQYSFKIVPDALLGWFGKARTDYRIFAPNGELVFRSSDRGEAETHYQALCAAFAAGARSVVLPPAGDWAETEALHLAQRVIDHIDRSTVRSSGKAGVTILISRALQKAVDIGAANEKAKRGDGK